MTAEGEVDWEGDFYKFLGEQMKNDAAFNGLVNVAAALIARVDGHESGEDPIAVPVEDEDEYDDEDDDEDEHDPAERIDIRIWMARWKIEDLADAYYHVEDHSCVDGAQKLYDLGKFVAQAAQMALGEYDG